MKRTKRAWPRFQVRVLKGKLHHFGKLYASLEDAECAALSWCVDNWRAFVVEVVVKYGNRADVLLQRYTPEDTPRKEPLNRW